MTTYLDALADKKYIPNAIIRFMGEYYSIRQPDSGLVVDRDKDGVVGSLNLNPTTIDPFRPTTTISSYSFSLVDKNGVVTAKLNGSVKLFQEEQVEIWIGRSTVDMDFANYLKLPNTYVAKASYQDARFTFMTQEAKDRLATGAFNKIAKLVGDIVEGTTIIGLQGIPSGWPTTGFAQIEQEFIQWTGIDSVNSRLTGCTRGEFGTAPAEHATGTDVTLVEAVQSDPITILLQILISGSGSGGPYDVLNDGCGIDKDLIDIEQFEQIRDEFFSGYTMRFRLGAIESLQDFIANEIQYPLGIRLRANNNSKIGLALLDRNIFEIDAPQLDHDEMTRAPAWSVDDTKITNRIRINWDWDDATKQYMKTSEFRDEDSIAEFGEAEWKELNFKGIIASLGGAELVDAIQLLTFGRFAFPRPVVDVNAHMSSSYIAMGDKVNVISSLIPNNEGSLNFASTLEVVQKAINFQSGDCKWQLAFTSFTGVRQCYLAPSDTIPTFVSQKIVNIGAGRGDLYRKGWKMRLYSNVTRDHASVQVNEIESVVGDVVTFVDEWSTTLVNSQFRIMFADYDDVTDQQKKFCFISAGENPFPDGKTPYQISFG